MYIITIKDSEYKCPDGSIVALALSKALVSNKSSIIIKDEESAAEYLRSLGCSVIKSNNDQ